MIVGSCVDALLLGSHILLPRRFAITQRVDLVASKIGSGCDRKLVAQSFEAAGFGKVFVAFVELAINAGNDAKTLCDKEVSDA